MAAGTESRWSNPDHLRGVQYRDDSNLAARQSIYTFQRPPIDLPAHVLDIAKLRGDEVVADIGCGNGRYLAELTRRGHNGLLVGIDLSPGMLASALAGAPGALLVVGEATALPLADHSVDRALAMHMLYHVPRPELAVREFRRVLRPGGQLLVALNGADHLWQLRRLIADALAEVAPGVVSSPAERLDLDGARTILAEEFDSVGRIDFPAELALEDPGPVRAYVRSLSETVMLEHPETLVDAVVSRIGFDDDGLFRVATHPGCLICQ